MNWRLIRVIDLAVGIILIWGCRCFSMFRHDNNSGHDTSETQRILLIKFWGIGNIFMMLPTIQALRGRYPGARIDFLTLESNRDALAAIGVADHIIEISTGSFPAFVRTSHHAILQLRHNCYDLIVDFEQFARYSALMAYQARAPRTVGFATLRQHRHYLYSNPVPYDNDIHITRSFYALAQEAGVSLPFSPHVQLGHLETLQSKGRALLETHHICTDKPIVVMHIGTSDNFKERRWPPQCYAALADLLVQRHAMQIILTGLSDEVFLIAETRQQLQSVDNVIDLGGKLDFADFFSLITAADLVISADTAAVHLASAVNIPVAGLYGPNTPLLYGPWGTSCVSFSANFHCSPCITNFNSKINTCRHPGGRGACMKGIEVEDVYSAINATFCTPESPLRLSKLRTSAS